MTEPRIRDLRYVALAVSGFERERDFFRDVWGLAEAGIAADLAHFRAVGSNEKFVLRVRRSEVTRLDLIGFAVETRAEVDAFHRKLASSGVKVIHAPRELTSPGGGYGFRLFDPDGHTLEISADVERGQSRTLHKGESIPVRLSHVVLHASDVCASSAFYEQNLGFRVSDWMGQVMCFLRCNTAHHRLAFLPGPPSLNHIAFDVQNVDEMMRGIARLAAAGTQLQWGPGRHRAGDNMFAYFRAPCGVSVEYAAGLAQVNEATWQPTVYPLTPDNADQWGTGRLFVGSPAQLPLQPDAGLWTPPPV